MIKTILLSVLLLPSTAALAQTLPGESPHDLIRDVIYNELQDRQRETYWQYRIEKKVGGQLLLEEQLETTAGPIYRLLALNGKPLDPIQQQHENARLDELMHNPGLQAHVKQHHEDDEQRLQRLMRLMPDAFIYTYDGADGALVRLSFRPNPDFNPPTYEARIFHALAGTVWVNPQQKRLARLAGTILERVDFGYGLFGHVDQGGKFELAREPVNAVHWKTSLVEVHIAGKVVLFKTIGADQRELRSDFKPVPPETTLEQARERLQQLPVPIF